MAKSSCSSASASPTSDAGWACGAHPLSASATSSSVGSGLCASRRFTGSAWRTKASSEGAAYGSSASVGHCEAHAGSVGPRCPTSPRAMAYGTVHASAEAPKGTKAS